MIHIRLSAALYTAADSGDLNCNCTDNVDACAVGARCRHAKQGACVLHFELLTKGMESISGHSDKSHSARILQSPSNLTVWTVRLGCVQDLMVSCPVGGSWRTRAGANETLTFGRPSKNRLAFCCKGAFCNGELLNREGDARLATLAGSLLVYHALVVANNNDDENNNNSKNSDSRCMLCKFRSFLVSVSFIHLCIVGVL